MTNEGIFFDLKEGEWVETNHWPKGRSRARLQSIGEGTTKGPFGDYSLPEARAKVEEFLAQEKAKSHGYTRFAIIPQASEPLQPEQKAKLRKLAADRKAEKQVRD